MVLFFTTTLCISIVGLLSLIILKRMELGSGRTILSAARPRMDGFFHRTLMFVEHVLPSLIQFSVIRTWYFLRRTTHRMIARMIYAFEHTLEKTLHIVREKTETPRATGQASSFLREIADHKKDLMMRSKNERVILDE